MEIVTTKEVSDEMWEHWAQERLYLDMEKERWEELEMRSIMEQEAKLSGKYAKVQLGKVGKQRKFEEYAKVEIRKLPRFIKKRAFKNL